MSRYFAFLRGINVGGHRVKMERLRELFEEAGGENTATFIASGNVIFDHRSKDEAALERCIEKHLHAGLGYEVATFIRSLTELQAITAHQPFPESDVAKEGHTDFVLFLRSPLGAAEQRSVEALRTERDEYHVYGREIYWLSRGPSLASLVKPADFGKATGKAECTARTITTIRKLLSTYGASG